MNQNKQVFQGVSETLLYPLYMRYRETRRGDGRIKDKRYSEIVDQVDYDFSDLEKVPEDSQLGIICRTLIFDNITERFISENPDATIVSLGSGLDFRFDRMDNGKVKWFDLDFPEVVEYRRRFFKENERNKFIASSIFDYSWMDFIPAKDNLLFLAEGLFVYFSKEEVKEVLSKISEKYPKSEMVLDVYSKYYIELLKNSISTSSALLNKIYKIIKWGMGSWSELKNWGTGISFIDEWFQIEMYKERLPKNTELILSCFPWIREFSRVGHIKFGVTDNSDSSDFGIYSQVFYDLVIEQMKMYQKLWDVF
ncbi:MAG: class I SAM-dependent methyltransferase [Desulfobacterales bacterium]|nr:class I SAM-dependent methyltransferase [Desulfobacterales bacterium]MCP4158765.1 class I SAM-dependent methyltransferase [Deltaproteobacteria bacterium]